MHNQKSSSPNDEHNFHAIDSSPGIEETNCSPQWQATEYPLPFSLFHTYIFYPTKAQISWGQEYRYSGCVDDQYMSILWIK